MICFLWIVAAIKLIVPHTDRKSIRVASGLHTGARQHFRRRNAGGYSKYRESGLPGGRRADGTPTGSGQGFCFVLSGYSGCCLVRRAILMVGYMIVTYIRLKKKSGSFDTD